jgi:hypothetical protein
VTSLITSFSAAIDVAVSNSPHSVATMPRPFRAMDSGASAPDARAISTWRVLSVTQLSKSQTAMAAIWARIPHWSHSSPDTCPPRNASAAPLSVGPAAVRPRVTIVARPSSRRSLGRGASTGRGAASAARDTARRRPPRPASGPATVDATQAYR